MGAMVLESLTRRQDHRKQAKQAIAFMMLTVNRFHGINVLQFGTASNVVNKFILGVTGICNKRTQSSDAAATTVSQTRYYGYIPILYSWICINKKVIIRRLC